MCFERKAMDDTKNETNTPCLKHAVSNLTEKSNDISSEVSLCTNCSKTMLSYIFLIQNVLDNLAKSIYGRGESQCCVQCLRQATQAEISKQDKSVDESEKTTNIVLKEEVVKQAASQEACYYKEETVNHAVSKELLKEDKISNSAAYKPKKPSSRRNSRRLSREIKCVEKAPLKTIDIANVNQDWKIDFLYDVAADLMPILPMVKSDRFMKSITIQGKLSKLGDESSKGKPPHINEEMKNHDDDESSKGKPSYLNEDKVKNKVLPNSNPDVDLLNDAVLMTGNHATSSAESTEILSNLSDESCEDNSPTHQQYLNEKDFVKQNEAEPSVDNFIGETVPFSSTEENVRFDNPDVPKKTPVHSSIAASTHTGALPEAFVTVCKNNSEAIGCLVLGSSLLLCRSSKILCVLVYDGVHDKLRELLASIFHVVQSVSSLDPVKNGSNSRKSLETLNVWRLTQFSKCVYLNSDTLVLRNCDELFNFSELSAVPDNGWPDCFNSGVFVFEPSLITVKKMNEMYESQGYREGGDQIFLNMYFNSWSEDLSKKLPFIYNLNLIGATTYTYAAAFQRFGQNVKIVQFSGSLKPWHIEFCSETNQIMDSSSIPKTSLRFVNEWMNIFRVSVTRLLPMDVYSLTFSQMSISAQNIIGFLCELERSDYVGCGTYSSDGEEDKASKNNFTETFSESLKKFSVIQHNIKPVESQIYNNFANPQHGETRGSICPEELKNPSPSKENLFPISSLIRSLPVTYDNYDGMRIWEQGKMDYEGIDNSESIIKRLQLLIQ